MQYLRNQLSDFKNSGSCLILTFLCIQRYTMYPPHLSYATALPCKTITMKIKIFIIVHVLKSNENMEIWPFRLSLLANSSKSCEKKFIWRRFQSVRPQLSHKLEVSWQSSVWPCWWSSVADHPVLFARLSSALRWYLAWVEMSCSVQA